MEVEDYEKADKLWAHCHLRQYESRGEEVERMERIVPYRGVVAILRINRKIYVLIGMAK